MDLGDALTVAKIKVRYEGEHCYLLISWQVDSFEAYLYNKDKLWKGRFSSTRLAGFSKNLQKSEENYFDDIKNCLSQERENYMYEMKSGFFYWKRKSQSNIIIEGFMPMELHKSPKKPNLVAVLLTLNNHLKDKINGLTHQYKSIKYEYEKSLNDTQEFLALKIDMEKALCDKFLGLLNEQNKCVNQLQLPVPGNKYVNDLETTYSNSIN